MGWHAAAVCLKLVIIFKQMRYPFNDFWKLTPIDAAFMDAALKIFRTRAESFRFKAICSAYCLLCAFTAVKSIGVEL